MIEFVIVVMSDYKSRQALKRKYTEISGSADPILATRPPRRRNLKFSIKQQQNGME
jgi:hypothetical protein